MQVLLSDLLHIYPHALPAAVHSLASQLTVNDVGDGQMVQGVMMLHDHYCLWSSLSQQDTVSLYRLAATALVPAAQGPSIGKRLTSATSSLRSMSDVFLPPAHPPHSPSPLPHLLCFPLKWNLRRCYLFLTFMSVKVLGPLCLPFSCFLAPFALAPPPPIFPPPPSAFGPAES